MLRKVEEALSTGCCGPEGCGERGSMYYNKRRCIADRCMAWRWAYKAKVGSPTVTSSMTTSYRQTEYEKLDRGYCGLAGHCHVD